MLLDKKIKNNLLRNTFSLFMAIAGFSQLTISSIKPSDLTILLLFGVLIIKGKIRISLLCVGFIFSFIYAWILGGISDFKALSTNVIIFVIVFSLISYLKRVSKKEIDLYLQYFNFSMFCSNFTALIIFLFLPQFNDLVADISSGGARFKGFFTQTNGYGFVLLVAFPISIYFFNKKKSIFNIANVLVFLISILLTQSRGVILSIIIGFAVVYLFYLIRSKKIKKYLSAIVLSLTFTIVLFTFVPDYLQETFGISLSRFNPEAEERGERNLNEVSLESLEGDRLYLIDNAIKTIIEYPFGLGYQPHHTKIGEITGVFLIPHNYFLSLFLYYGIFLGLFWVAIIFILLKKGMIKVIKLEVSPDEPLFYLIIMMISLSLFYLTHSSDWSYMYILIGFYAALLSRNTKTNETTSHRKRINRS